MSRVTMAMRKHYLHQELNNLNEMSKNIHKKLMELHKYAASVARGYITPLAMAGMPNSCMPFAMAFALDGVFVNKLALQKAARIWGNQYGNAQTGMTNVQAANQFGSTVSTMLENPQAYEAALASIPDEKVRNEENMKNQYMLHMFQEAQKAEQAEFRKHKEAEIKVMEDEIQQEKLMVDSRKEAVKGELQSVEQAEPEAIKRSMSKYA